MTHTLVMPGWIEPMGAYSIRVRFSSNDYAILVPVGAGRLVDAASAFADIAGDDLASLLADGKEARILERLLLLLRPDAQEILWLALDDVLSVAVRRWKLDDYADAVGVAAPACPTNEVAQGERMGIWRALPLLIVGRMLLAVIWQVDARSAPSTPGSDAAATPPPGT